MIAPLASDFKGRACALIPRICITCAQTAQVGIEIPRHGQIRDEPSTMIRPKALRE
jgi:hypothetical protein